MIPIQKAREKHIKILALVAFSSLCLFLKFSTKFRCCLCNLKKKKKSYLITTKIFLKVISTVTGTQSQPFASNSSTQAPAPPSITMQRNEPSYKIKPCNWGQGMGAVHCNNGQEQCSADIFLTTNVLLRPGK